MMQEDDLPDWLSRGADTGLRGAREEAMRELSGLLGEAKDAGERIRDLQAEVKAASEGRDVLLRRAQRLMEENALQKVTTADGVVGTLKLNARGKVVDWREFMGLLQERGETGLVSLSLSARHQEMLLEFVRVQGGALGPDDVMLACPWNRLESWMREYAAECGVDLLDVSVPGLEVDSWAEVRVK